MVAPHASDAEFGMPDGIIRRLQEIGVDPASGDGSFRYEVHQARTGSSGETAAAARSAAAMPLVSCLMVTRGNLDILKYSAQCYRQQTYPNRELVVVTDAALAAPVDGFLRQGGVPNITVVGVGPSPGLTLGDLRNIALARARGDILVQWDDDDLFDPRRIAAAVAVLRQSGAAAAFLTRWLVWWPQRAVAAVSNRRMWEGSMAVLRTYAPVYPALAHGEDSAAVQFLVDNYPVALMDVPCHYVYAVTGKNTFQTAHFEDMIARADCVFHGADFRELNRLLSRRLPVLEYAAQLQDS